MSKPEWGIKRVCPSCNIKYYDMALCREPLGHFVDVEIYCFLAVFLHPCATTSGCIIASVCHYIWLCYCIRVPLGSTSPPPLYYPSIRRGEGGALSVNM